MNDFFAFLLPVTIVGMVLGYRLLKMRMNRQVDSEPIETKDETYGDLAHRAGDLKRRIENIEEILYDDPET